MTIFTPEALEAVHQYARGVPRVINLICEHSLISAFAEQQRQITPQVVHAVAEDFELTTRHDAPPAADAPAASVLGVESDLDLATALKALNTMEKLSRRLREVEAAAPKKGVSAQ